MECYSYEPLQRNHIRLFILLPGTFGEELRCVLRNVELPPAKAWHRLAQGQDMKPETGTKRRESNHISAPKRESNIPSKQKRSQIDEQSASAATPEKRLTCRAPLYEAISYVWGPQEPHEFLRIEGKNGGTLVIGPNLHDALQRLRPSPNHSARVLWADQICIDQGNLEERTNQVQRMKDVYKSAQKVLIWLGEEDEYTALGFDFLKRLHESIDAYSPQSGEDIRRRLAQEYANRLPRVYMDHHVRIFGDSWRSSETDLEAVDCLLSWCLAAINKVSYRSWFERTWTFQEVMLAQDAVLLCGSHSISWKVFEKYITSLVSYSFPSSRLEGEALGLSEYDGPSQLAQKMRFDTDQPLIEFLSSRRVSKCQDPRDKVIALLGVLDESFEKSLDEFPGRHVKRPSELVRPSYEEPAEHIFTRTARSLVQITGTLDILWHTNTDSKLSNVPTWVPDWSSETSQTVAAQYIWPESTLASSHPRWMCEAVSETHSPELKVATLKQDIINSLDCFDEQFDANFLQESTSSSIYGLTSQPLQIAAKQMMLPSHWTGINQAALAAFLGLERSTNYGNYHARDEPLEKQIARLDSTVKRQKTGSRMFCGANGSIGYGPAYLEAGDEIHLLLGLDVPVALRPTNDGFRFKGLCYVHGLMHGEGLHPGRIPQSCYYPGCNANDENWVLDPVERLEKQHEVKGNTWWKQFESRSEALEWFKSNSADLQHQSWIQDASWSPEVVEFGEQSIWLLEKGCDPVPIMFEEITLV